MSGVIVNRAKNEKSSLNNDYDLIEVFQEIEMKKPFIKVILRVRVAKKNLIDLYIRLNILISKKKILIITSFEVEISVDQFLKLF